MPNYVQKQCEAAIRCIISVMQAATCSGIGHDAGMAAQQGMQECGCAGQGVQKCGGAEQGAHGGGGAHQIQFHHTLAVARNILQPLLLVLVDLRPRSRPWRINRKSHATSPPEFHPISPRLLVPSWYPVPSTSPKGALHMVKPEDRSTSGGGKSCTGQAGCPGEDAFSGVCSLDAACTVARC